MTTTLDPKLVRMLVAYRRPMNRKNHAAGLVLQLAYQTPDDVKRGRWTLADASDARSAHIMAHGRHPEGGEVAVWLVIEVTAEGYRVV